MGGVAPVAVPPCPPRFPVRTGRYPVFVDNVFQPVSTGQIRGSVVEQLVSKDPGCAPVTVLPFTHILIYIYGVNDSGFVRIMVRFPGRVCTVAYPAVATLVTLRPPVVYLIT
jgi:hypothetical protein